MYFSNICQPRNHVISGYPIENGVFLVEIKIYILIYALKVINDLFTIIVYTVSHIFNKLLIPTIGGQDLPNQVFDFLRIHL